jgi:hypothetical protein
MNPSTSATRSCIGINDIPAHEVPWDEQHLAPWAMDPARKNIRCRDCDREYRRSRRAANGGKTPQATRQAVQAIRSVSFATSEDGDDKIPASEVGHSHEYVPNPELVALWQAVVSGVIDHGDPPANIIFFGPKGSGKTEGAQWLAALSGLPFLKVDAASMTDPESWFGTREIVPEGGIAVTKYIPSALVTAVQRPGVVFVDEFNRVDDEHRNVWLPLTDGTGRVMNPLTGEVIVRHPHCFIIMAGNRGLEYTGTSAIDPAFTSRALSVEFDYIDETVERKVAQDATGCDEQTAFVFTRFAAETRQKAKADPDFSPISTREVILACRTAARGLSRDLAAKFAILTSSSAEGGDQSIRTELESIWNGVRLTKEELSDPGAPVADPGVAPVQWTCPTHHKVKVVPAGISKTGKPYPQFRACPEPYCDETEGRRGQNAQRVLTPAATANLVCPSCNFVNPLGQASFCSSCGAVLS